MRRVLLVSYYTPPRPGVATTRTQQLMKYLPRYGWHVTVLTPALPGAVGEIIETPYLDLPSALKRMVGLGTRSAHETLRVAPAPRGTQRTLRQSAITWGYRLTSYPDAQAGWFLPGRKVLSATLKNGEYDAILSTSPPFTTDLMIASVKRGIPWISDHRDLWGDNHAYSSPLRRRTDRWLETIALRHANAITTVSNPLAHVIRSHGHRVEVDVIPNAFDAEEWSDIPFAAGERTTLVHAGQMFGGRRDPRPLFRVVRSLIDAGEIKPDELHIDLYCNAEEWLSQAIMEAGLGDVVRIKGFVSRDEIMRAERAADRLIIFLWEGPNTEGILTGKLFEYLGAQRYILAIGGPPTCAIDEVLARAQAGVRVRDEDALRHAVLAAILERRRQGAPAATDANRLAPYMATEMAQLFATILERVVAASPAPRVGELANAARYSQ